MTQIKLSDTKPGQKIRMKPNTVILEVHLHLHGQTRLLLGKEGFWRQGSDIVYLAAPLQEQ